jgi:hypothetical protein
MRMCSLFFMGINRFILWAVPVKLLFFVVYLYRIISFFGEFIQPKTRFGKFFRWRSRYFSGKLKTGINSRYLPNRSLIYGLKGSEAGIH